ncbi:MAG: phosphate ABC transporter substrate-binding protein [Acidobacteria bacterium]|nr:phosphate ABC transporter substrate-binding protein [Acidobacteriota bacterium]MBU4307390.1 phosphate ABC transporter substrate-binding protein [Acidobacteriota bacterium]MCG2811619.1 phosphate ABC transporter substrate-binding protein [Candidatus Aminicenantes bacterium]
MAQKNRIFSGMVVCLAMILGFSGCGRPNKKDSAIQIKGSDTMVNLGQAWAEAFMQADPKVSVAVTGGGSGTGIASLLSNTCDIAELSRELKSEEIAMAKQKGFEPKQIIVALDGLAVVVNTANPLSQLTLDQLAAIFSGSVSNWQEVGGADLPIVLLSREVNSGTHVYFKEHVLRRGKENQVEFAASALMLPSSQAIADEVAQNPGAIGYYGMGYISAREKALAIAMDSASPYIQPTIENVVSQAYPISRPLIMVTHGKPSGLVARFIDFVLSPEGQKIVVKIDFVPVKNN